MVIPLIFGAMLLKGKKYVEVTNLEELNLEGRVELVINESNKEGIFESAQLTSLIPALMMREELWDALISRENLSIEEIKKTRQEVGIGLLSSGCNDAQLEFLMNDSYAGFRPLKKTPLSSLFAGFIAAFFTGLFACKWMISLVKNSKLKYFAFYCIAVGLISIVYATF